ncbi:MAG TPA: hypothetical protein PKI46_10090, partial [Bacteroidales bacterium]|nr:hypothetical protein [Bacteroidales bacterium]
EETNVDIFYLPLIKLRSYNGSIHNAIIFTVDLAGAYLINNKQFESIEKKENYPTIQCKGSLLEYLTYPAYKKNAGLSDFTSKWKKDRKKVMGKDENKIAKLIQCDINEEKDYVDFFWLTESTEDKKNQDSIYNKPKKEVDPNTFELKNNPSKTYTFQLRILDFFKWLDTYPNKKEITAKDIKDILYVSNIQIWDSNPSFQFQGFNYINTLFDASIYPETRPPKVWNKYHNDNSFLGKHGQGIMNHMNLYKNNMASMLTKQLKDKGYLQ